MLALVIGLSVMRILASIELLHLGLQLLLKVGLTLPVSQLNHPYKCIKPAPYGRSTGLSASRLCRRYMPWTHRANTWNVALDSNINSDTILGWLLPMTS